MRYDYHVHTTYSDGAETAAMVEAAAAAGLDGVGFTDHCNVSDREPGASLPWDFDETYPERRREIRDLRDRFDVRIFDAVEMDYRPDEADRIGAFLDEAAFDYAIGSVHHVGGRSVMSPGEFADDSEAERRAFVDRYFDLLIDLIDSELFDVAAHVDLPERNPDLRGHATPERYREVAEAFAASRTVPELNAGRAFAGYRELHPHPEFLDVLLAEGISFVAGTDSHTPEEIIARVDYLDRLFEERGVETIEL